MVACGFLLRYCSYRWIEISFNVYLQDLGPLKNPENMQLRNDSGQRHVGAQINSNSLLCPASFSALAKEVNLTHWENGLSNACKSLKIEPINKNQCRHARMTAGQTPNRRRHTFSCLCHWVRAEAAPKTKSLKEFELYQCRRLYRIQALTFHLSVLRPTRASLVEIPQWISVLCLTYV